MKRYIKFDQNGQNAYEAPFKMVLEDGSVIYGYNAPSNETMLLADGWLKYEGTALLSHLKLVNGEIVELIIPIPEPTLPTKFTKLSIRRCLRKHGLEDQLDDLLSANYSFKKDWDDCLDIDLEDDMMQEAIAQGLVSQELITLIQRECQGIDG